MASSKTFSCNSKTSWAVLRRVRSVHGHPFVYTLVSFRLFDENYPLLACFLKMVTNARDSNAFRLKMRLNALLSRALVRLLNLFPFSPAPVSFARKGRKSKCDRGKCDNQAVPVTRPVVQHVTLRRPLYAKCFLSCNTPPSPVTYAA